MFAHGGETVLTDLFFPDAGPYTLSLQGAKGADEGDDTVRAIRLSRLGSSW